MLQVLNVLETYKLWGSEVNFTDLIKINAFKQTLATTKEFLSYDLFLHFNHSNINKISLVSI